MTGRAHSEAVDQSENLFGGPPAQHRPADDLVTMVVLPAGPQTAAAHAVPIQDGFAILPDDIDAMVVLPPLLAVSRRANPDGGLALVREQALAAHPRGLARDGSAACQRGTAPTSIAIVTKRTAIHSGTRLGLVRACTRVSNNAITTSNSYALPSIRASFGRAVSRADTRAHHTRPAPRRPETPRSLQGCGRSSASNDARQTTRPRSDRRNRTSPSRGPVPSSRRVRRRAWLGSLGIVAAKFEAIWCWSASPHDFSQPPRRFHVFDQATYLRFSLIGHGVEILWVSNAVATRPARHGIPVFERLVQHSAEKTSLGVIAP